MFGTREKEWNRRPKTKRHLHPRHSTHTFQSFASSRRPVVQSVGAHSRPSSLSKPVHSCEGREKCSFPLSLSLSPSLSLASLLPLPSEALPPPPFAMCRRVQNKRQNRRGKQHQSTSKAGLRRVWLDSGIGAHSRRNGGISAFPLPLSPPVLNSKKGIIGGGGRGKGGIFSGQAVTPELPGRAVCSRAPSQRRLSSRPLSSRRIWSDP